MRTRLARTLLLDAPAPPLDEPGLPELIVAGRRANRLSFTTDAATALHGAGVLWVTFDTPLGANNLAAAPSTYTNCRVSFGRARWPDTSSHAKPPAG